MSSINPFAQFIIQEFHLENKSEKDTKHWQMEESIFQKPAGETVKQENLLKTSSEMFVIYKFTNDPFMKVKSAKYTEDKFVCIKDLYTQQTLLETSPLSIQLQNF